MTIFSYRRRPSIRVDVGGTPLGYGLPIRIQSMTNTPTNDIEASASQARKMADAGAEYVRLTAQGVREAGSLAEIKNKLAASGYSVPLVADIHFNPRAAFAAAEVVEKVRINPGNFADPGRTFRHLEYSDSEYAAEIDRIDNAVTPFLELCRKHSTAIRIGVNHGSLSDRIMSRYGNTPAGMAESAMEFLRICVKRGFKNVVVSMKASNTVVMVESVRRLVAAMDAENMAFPIHLGVTEAGDAEDGRIKSAVGIGALLADGIGDTVRVSLSEPPENELPVARELVNYISARENAPVIEGVQDGSYDPVSPLPYPTVAYGIIGGSNPTRVIETSPDYVAGEFSADRNPEAYISPDWQIVDCSDTDTLASLDKEGSPIVLTSRHADPVGEMKRAFHILMHYGVRRPVVIKLAYNGLPSDIVTIRSSADFGALLLAGFGNAICLEADKLRPRERADIAFGILQAARRRFTKTEYIACPGCGRTLFDLQDTLRRVKEATSHLKGLKIGIMGCIVNGPGEMADADYGYVGAAAGNVSLYRGKECVEKNIPSEHAVERLVEFLKSEGVWTD